MYAIYDLEKGYVQRVSWTKNKGRVICWTNKKPKKFETKEEARKYLSFIQTEVSSQTSELEIVEVNRFYDRDLDHELLELDVLLRDLESTLDQDQRKLWNSFFELVLNDIDFNLTVHCAGIEYDHVVLYQEDEFCLPWSIEDTIKVVAEAIYKKKGFYE